MTRCHRASRVGRLLKVVVGAGRHLVVVDLLGRRAAHREREQVLQLGLRGRKRSSAGAPTCQAQRRRAARDDRDAVHRVDVVAAARQARGPSRGRDARSFSFSLITRTCAPGPCRAVDRLLELLLGDRVSRRAASSAASFTTFSRSAPVKPGVRAATYSARPAGRAPRRARAPAGSPRGRAGRAGPRRPAVEAARPDSAGSSTSGRFVAAMMMTPLRGVEAVHLDQELVQGLLALVVGAEPGAHRAARPLPIVSISSRNTSAGAFSFACWNSSRTRAAPEADEHLDELRAAT